MTYKQVSHCTLGYSDCCVKTQNYMIAKQIASIDTLDSTLIKQKYLTMARIQTHVLGDLLAPRAHLVPLYYGGLGCLVHMWLNRRLTC